MAMKTRICDLFGIEVPVLLAGMGGASTPELAAAVSNAGGLGVLGAAGCGPKQLREWIQRADPSPISPLAWTRCCLPPSAGPGSTAGRGSACLRSRGASPEFCPAIYG